MQTVAPEERPINRLSNKFIKEEVAPTAARELLPANLPTTIISAALYNSCKIPVRIIGIVKNRSPVEIGPFVMSISFFIKSLKKDHRETRRIEKSMFTSEGLKKQYIGK